MLAGALVAGAILLYPTAVPGDLVLPPVDVDDVFGAEHVAEAKRYERFLYAVWILAQVALLATLVVYARRGASFARESAAGPIGTGLLLGMLGLGLVWLVLLPLRLASYWWARRHDVVERGFLDWLVGDWTTLAAEFLAISLALAVLMALAGRLGERWWLPGAAALVGIVALLTFVAPYLESTEPLEDEVLAASAERDRRELGLPPIPVRVREVSERTRQANAYAYGLGPSRKVVLWDTLLDEPFELDEQEVVVAHELAHHSETHLPEGLAWFAIFAMPGAWLLMRATRRRGGLARPEAVPLALLVVAALQLVAAPAANHLSQRIEAEADWVALEISRDPAALEGAMVGFSELSLGDPTPPGWVQALAGTHPAMADRVAMARAWAERNAEG